MVRLKSQESIRTLRGRLRWEGDLDAMRRSRFENEPEPGHNTHWLPEPGSHQASSYGKTHTKRARPAF